MPELSRRSLLKLTAAGAGGALLGGLAPSVLRLDRPAQAAGSLDAVKHVVVFMQENRSFDHYFGGLSGMRGFDDRTAVLRNGTGGKTVFAQPSGSGTEYPFRLDTTVMDGQGVADLSHSWSTGHQAWHGGKSDAWVAAKGGLTMGYYTRADLPFHYALADAYTTCDAYFCSVMGPTNPNRLYVFTGMIDPTGTGGGPVTDNTEPGGGFTWTTYPERLESAGVSWKVYQQTDNYDDNALAWFANFKNAQAGNPLHDRGLATVPDVAAAIRADVTAGTLPQVSFVIAPANKSEHPPYPPAYGAALTADILNALAADQATWDSTVAFLTYDENDGFFDHIVPPTPPAGTAAEFVGGAPIGLGVRVPMVVISPWSRGGAVCSQVFDHTSVLRFLEAWTGVHEPNISDWRRAVCGDLTSAFDFGGADTSIPTLPDTAALVAAADQQHRTLPAASVPGTTAQPSQEPGTRTARPLPYQQNATARVDRAAGRLWLTMTNAGSATAHLAAYVNAYRTDGPWQYDVPASGTVSDYFSVQRYGKGKYDISLHGANGFLRRYVGDINAAGGVVEVSPALDPATGLLTVSMANTGAGAVTVTVRANAYRTDGPWQYQVAAGATVTDTWNVAAYGNHWYDLTATVDVDPLFSRRFAGHLETGQSGVTG
ncbi:phospholipase C, phosphocholine-specific [Solihabitans fulvus]|uniref:phospholipase C n=1 Tax=Solihabitans fulvus TaxID=1892852 RepID=A0A5B2XV30_9PSEU|nr:phospholipase C, phosphocholine-specific [Solihabitans fulvus]KAA2267015.1 phospholipase C, phosphocholine-specific [Solihabitans fulvus]